jgi:hypothetical protein
MTLLNVEGFDELERRLGEDGAGEFISDITAHLKVHSVNGEAVGRNDDNQFGLVHDPAVDVSSLEDSISDRVREVDPEGKGVQVEGSTVVLEDRDVSEEHNGRALLYTINKFSERHGDFTVDALSEGYKMMLDDTRERVVEFKSIIDAGKFDTVFQPIVDLQIRDIQHSEALIRFHGAQNGKSPFELITFAEEVGVISRTSRRTPSSTRRKAWATRSPRTRWGGTSITSVGNRSDGDRRCAFYLPPVIMVPTPCSVNISRSST